MMTAAAMVETVMTEVESGGENNFKFWIGILNIDAFETNESEPGQ